MHFYFHTLKPETSANVNKVSLDGLFIFCDAPHRTMIFRVFYFGLYDAD